MSEAPRIAPGFSHGVLTPMTPDGEVDYAALERLAEFHVTRGRAASLCLLLHLGELPALSLEERRGVVDCVTRAVGGRTPIYVHITTPELDRQVELGRHAARAGAAAVIAMPPYCRGLSPAATEAHFRALAERIETPLILYHSPHTGHAIPADLPGRLAHEGVDVVGLKDASFDLDYARQVLAGTAGADFAFMPGIEHLAPYGVLGLRSAFSVIGALAPNLVHALEGAVAADAWEEVAPLQLRTSALLGVIARQYPASIKAASAILGRPVGPPREPLLALTSAQQAELAVALEPLLEAEPHGW